MDDNDQEIRRRQGQNLKRERMVEPGPTQDWTMSRGVRKVGPHPANLDTEMRRRSELEDEYGGGAGDWDH